MIRNIKRGDGVKSGIYKITNLINGKYYIGSTKHLSSRYRTHLYTLKNNKSGCIILQNAVNKYGLNNFEFSVIDICDNYKEREIALLSQGIPPYNCIKETKIRREISDDTKQRMSIGVKESYRSGKRKFTSNKGRKYNRIVKASVELISDNETINFDNVEECANQFNCSQQAIYLNFYRKTLLNHKYKVNIIN